MPAGCLRCQVYKGGVGVCTALPNPDMHFVPEIVHAGTTRAATSGTTRGNIGSGAGELTMLPAVPCTRACDATALPSSSGQQGIPWLLPHLSASSWKAAGSLRAAASASRVASVPPPWHANASPSSARTPMACGASPPRVSRAVPGLSARPHRRRRAPPPSPPLG